jgi:hypothetical protein
MSNNQKGNCGSYDDPAKEYQRISGGGKRQAKKKGGSLDYPFPSEEHQYPIPPRVSFPIGTEISTNNVTNNDLYGCKLTGGAKRQQKLKGGDCGCGGQTMQLGGKSRSNHSDLRAILNDGQKKRKQKGAGLGYTFDLEHPITNKPEVVRYETVSAYAGVDTVMKGGKSRSNQNDLRAILNDKQKQKGGSAASDSLMNYFLDFQHRCGGSEIY